MADEEDVEENEDEAAEGADGEEGEGGGDGEGEDGEGGGGKKKLLIIVGAVLILLIGGGAGAYFMGLLDPLLGKAEVEMVPQLDEHGEPVLDDHGEPVMVPKAGGDDHGEGGDDHGDGHGDEEDDYGEGGDDGHGEKGAKAGKFLEIPTMLVNLNSDDGVPRYLRLTVQLEMKKSGDVKKVEAVMPRVVDQFQTYLRELRVKDLRGSAGIYRLQMELLWRVNQAAAPVEVKDVLFQEILIQ